MRKSAVEADVIIIVYHGFRGSCHNGLSVEIAGVGCRVNSPVVFHRWSLETSSDHTLQV